MMRRLIADGSVEGLRGDMERWGRLMGVGVGAAGPDGGSAAAAVVPVAAVRYGQCWSHGRGEGRSQILEYEMICCVQNYIFMSKIYSSPF